MACLRFKKLIVIIRESLLQGRYNEHLGLVEYQFKGAKEIQQGKKCC